MIGNVSSIATLCSLVFTRAIPNARSAHSSTRFGDISVDLVIGVKLGAMSAILVGIALVLGPNAGEALAMPGLGCSIGVLFGVLMALWTFSNVRLPAIAVPRFVGSILNWSAPIQVFKESIHGIIIFMESLRSVGPRTHETFKHQDVNPDLPRLAVPVQSVCRISAPLDTPRHHVSEYPSTVGSDLSVDCANGSVSRANAAPVGYFVIRVVDNWNPSFFTSHKARITSINNGGN